MAFSFAIAFHFLFGVAARGVYFLLNTSLIWEFVATSALEVNINGDKCTNILTVVSDIGGDEGVGCGQEPRGAECATGGRPP